MVRATKPRNSISTAARQAAIEFARAAAMRPQIVGAALQRISQDREIANAMFQTLETQNITAGEADITVVPKNSTLVADLLAAQETRSASKPAQPAGAKGTT